MIRRLLQRWYEWVPPLIVIAIAIAVVKYLEGRNALSS